MVRLAATAALTVSAATAAPAIAPVPVRPRRPAPEAVPDAALPPAFETPRPQTGPSAGRADGRPASTRRRWLLLMWLCSWIIYGACFQAQWAYGERPIFHITGDEPHYLLIATSLLRDGDVEVLNNYREKHYFSFYPYHVGDSRDPEDMHAFYGRGGRLYSKHNLGLPLLLLPAMRLGGHGLAIVFTMAVAAVLAVQIYLLALEASGRRWAAIAAWLAMSFSAPLLFYADLFYPEVAGALLVIAGVRTLLAAGGGVVSRADALRAGLALGLLPWFHLRYIPLAAILGLALLVALLPRVQRPRLPWLVAPAALGGLALLGVSWHLFGGVPAVDEYGTLAPSQILNGLAGLFFDRQFGLLVYAPIYLLAVFGLPLLPRRLPSLAAWSILILLGAYTVFIAGFSYWYGAFSPPSRMLVPVVPVLAVPLALALAHLPPWRCRSLAGVLSLLSLAVVVLLVRVPRLRYNQSDGHSEVLHYLSETWGRDLTAVVPSFLVPSADAYAWAMGATVAIGVLYFLLTVSPTRSVR